MVLQYVKKSTTVTIMEEMNNQVTSVTFHKTNNRSRKLTILPQVFAVIVKNILVLPIGMTIGFTTILIPKLIGDDPNESFHLNEEEISWIGSTLSISSCAGSIASGLIAQQFGRKIVMIGLAIPFSLAWIIYYFAAEKWHLFFALTINGFCSGLTGPSVFSYIAEITQPHVRGMLSATSSLTTIFGVFSARFLGTFLSWRLAALLSSVLPMIAFCLLWSLPESPGWLLSKGRIEEARKSLAWFRGWTTVDNIQTEFQDMCNGYNKDKSDSECTTSVNSLSAKVQIFLKKSFLYPLTMVSFLFILSTFTGGLTLQTYGVLIFATLDVPINKYYASLLMGICEFIGCVVSIILVGYIGKRKMGLTSLSGIVLCDVLVGLYAIINNVKYLDLELDFTEVSIDSISGYRWIPFILLLMIAFIGYCGLKPLPWILVGEVFSYDTRGFGCGMCTAVFFIMGFVSNKVYLKMISSLTFPGVYWFYGSVGFIGLTVIYFILPETEGKTLQEINDHFAGRSKLDNKVRRMSKVHPSPHTTNAVQVT